MFQNYLYLYPNTQPPGSGSTENIHTRRNHTALQQFKSALRKGKLARLKRRFTHRPHCLYDLHDVKSQLAVRGSHYTGIQVVGISSIIGSEGRTGDFDADFYPLGEASRERWVNMAVVYLSRLPVPPIQLVQIGEAYFVRDGHHRISVARAFGQTAIDGEVVLWNVSAPFPWHLSAVREPSCQLKSLDLSV